ncbi:MAG TPA: 1,4-alpha-glucan branching protein GlgB [Bryobacteraceae bacterium]|nr:1,4-alpha-glucan branching protein GlgB [Bryobacteraceae bacterium]
MSSTFLTDFDLHLLAEGTHYRSYSKLGAQLWRHEERDGAHFAVWAPNAESVSVIGNFNGWDPDANPMRFRPDAGLWECFVPGIGHGALYKYHVASKYNGYRTERADPYGFAAEMRPQTASKVWDLSGYQWGDGEWMRGRAQRNSSSAPIAAYEVHLGSWKRVREENNRWMTYREMAPRLADYVGEMGFTHVEFLPVMEHPFDGSWGYQTVGYFAPTSRFGTPDDFMYLVDTLHQHGIGVFMDWVPGHFPTDGHGLAFFDGTHLYEHADPRQGKHPDWDTFVFNYGRTEVRNFLISNAVFWLEKYHIDGLRVDAVASMLYLDYGRRDGEWMPNKFGGRENLEAIDFLRTLNEVVYGQFPDVVMVAEDSTAWPMVSQPTYLGGLGFGLKWNMGWMHDMLDYMSKDPIHRSFHHNRITFSLLYAFNENFVLPFSHDEVVHGKSSMIGKMPGDDWQKFANLRVLYGYMIGHPGKKLLFMGGEFGQWREWNHDEDLDWPLIGYPQHRGLQRWVRDINTFYRSEPALHQLDCDPGGFEWIDCSDTQRSVVSFLRKGRDPLDTVAFVCNFTPMPRHNYRIGTPTGGDWREVLNSDATLYGGSGQGNLGGAVATPVGAHGRPFSLNITVPPLAVVAFRRN